MNYLWAVLVFSGGEIIGLMLFALLKKYIGPPIKSRANKTSTIKGILERLTMLIGLIHGFPQILIAFGAIKLGTRLHEEKECEISNNYFLIGNLISILLAMIYAVIVKMLSHNL